MRPIYIVSFLYVWQEFFCCLRAVYIPAVKLLRVSVGQTILMSEEYTPGTVFDRNGEVIAAGDSGELCWSTEETRDAFLQVLGPDIHSTLLSGTTILGNCAWVFGTEDNRWGIYSLLHPAAGKIGGSVKLTLDRRLQEYAAQLVRKRA